MRKLLVITLLVALSLGQTIEQGSTKASIGQCTAPYPLPCQLQPSVDNNLLPPTNCITSNVNGNDLLVFTHQRGLSFHLPSSSGVSATPILTVPKNCSRYLVFGQVGEWLYFSPNTDDALFPDCNCDAADQSQCLSRGLRFTYPDGHNETFPVAGMVGTPSVYSVDSVVTLPIKLASQISSCPLAPTPITNDLTGSMAMIQRGACAAAGKAYWPQEKGAAATLFFNPQSTGNSGLFYVNTTVPGLSIGVDGQKIFNALNGTGAIGYGSFGPGIYSSVSPVSGDRKSGLQRINVTAAALGVAQIELVRGDTTGASYSTFIESTLGGSRSNLWLFGENGKAGIQIFNLESSPPTLLATFPSFSSFYGPLNYTMCNGFIEPSYAQSGIVQDVQWTRLNLLAATADEQPTVESWGDRHYLIANIRPASYVPSCSSQIDFTALTMWNITDVTNPEKIYFSLKPLGVGPYVVTARNVIKVFNSRVSTGQAYIVVYPRLAVEPGFPTGSSYIVNVSYWVSPAQAQGKWARIDKNGKIWVGLAGLLIGVFEEDSVSGVVREVTTQLVVTPAPNPAEEAGWMFPSCSAGANSAFDIYSPFAIRNSGTVGGSFTRIDYVASRLVSATTTSSSAAAAATSTSTTVTGNPVTMGIASGSTSSSTTSGATGLGSSTSAATTASSSTSSSTTTDSKSSSSVGLAVPLAMCAAALLVLV